MIIKVLIYSGYKDVFVWEEYFQDVDPVPFEFFTSEQIHGMTVKDFPISKVKSINHGCEYTKSDSAKYSKTNKIFLMKKII